MKQILVSDKIYLIACTKNPSENPHQEGCFPFGELSVYIPIEKLPE